MDEEFGILLLVMAVVVILVGIAIVVSATPPTVINAEDIYKYDGMKIQTTVTIDHHITDRTEFEYMMMIPICTTAGKGATICNYIFVPIFDDYSVYKIKEGYYIANDFNYDFQDGQTYEIIGRVEHDYNDEHLFCVVVYEVLPA